MDSKEPKQDWLTGLQSKWESFVEILSGEREIAAGNELSSWLDRLDRLSWKRWAAIFCALLVVMSGLGYAFLGASARHTALHSSQTIYFTVKDGMNAGDVADALVAHGILESKTCFWLKVKVGGYQNQFKIGTYAMHPRMEPEEVLRLLISGETTTIKFTIPEGFGIKEMAKRLGDAGIVDEKEFLRQARDFAPYGYMKKRKDVRYAAEGFLFPDTYEIQTDMDERSIMEMMADDFDTRLTEEMRDRAKKMDLSIYDLVTLASLVEKEARYDEDRPIIAQVFFKRLEEGMPLQTDASLQYLMDAPKEDVSLEDTEIESPYNTYLNSGLPPGPIASPGMEAIEAVLYPADTDYLYFVADRQGHNYYSMTYDEHMERVREVR